ncbi:MAG TPA: ABC transporter permease [Gemmatimonadaceae bacterium]|nr:ABC transporter permease [Gemmatimonadaceae bacterium]
MNYTLARNATAAAVVVCGTLALLAAIVAVAGYAPGPALEALWRGSFGSWYSFTSATLVRATPLIIVGIATTLAFRAGVFNIGGEGQLLVGASLAAFVVLGVPAGAWSVPLGLGAGAIGGAVWAAIPAVMRHRFGVLEVITTLMLNAVAIQLVGWLVHGPLQEPTHVYPQSATIASPAQLPIIASGTRMHAGVALALLLAAGAWWFATQTAAGFRWRAVGANPHAAAVTGRIDVARTVFIVFVASGALAGLAGAVEVQGVALALYESLSPGYGYTAIAVALLARLDPRAVVPSALLFAALEAGAGAMQRDAGVPSVLVKIVEAALILVVLAFDARQRRRLAVAVVA